MQETTFYEQLQTCIGLDLRDNRGKQLNLAYHLLGLTLGLLRGRDGCLSSIHRSIVNNHSSLCMYLGIENIAVVSRSHFPILLSKVDLATFESLLFANYGIELDIEQKSWFAGDGKELRGSIPKGAKRGQAIVQLSRHEDKAVLCQDFYNGKKESEKPCFRNLLINSGAIKQKISADALHLNPKTTSIIQKAGGIFLIGLKGNQKELYEDMQKYSTCFTAIDELQTTERGHGRIEKRHYFHYDISGEYFDKRWSQSNFQSLFKVNRYRRDLQSGKSTNEISYYISNGSYAEKENYFAAIRNHWCIEVNNHIRDVTLNEDALKTKKTAVTKVMAGVRTLAIKLLSKTNAKNLVAQLELFQDDFKALLKWLRSVNFL